jgi:hypothetical protein
VVRDEKAGDSPLRGQSPRNKSGDSPQRNAPGRWRLRPAFRLTAAEATATRRTINLGRSVLGALTTLWATSSRVKAPEDRVDAICELFFSHRSNCGSLHVLWNLSKNEKGRALRPGRKSRRLDGGSQERRCRLCRHRSGNSPSRERFRPPSRRTVRFRVVLLGGLRPTGAPCSAQAGLLQIRSCRSRACPKEFRANCGRRAAPCPRSGPVEGVWGNREVPPARASC